MHRLALLIALLLPGALLAETLIIPIGSQGADIDTQNLPHKGESQRSVLERFGLADEEHAPVGKPPITRWDYRDFSVYFEYEHVIDSVRHHQPRHPAKEQQ
ncbi:phosphodiesterase [Pseudomonas sp. GOM7]|uniref:phosphodiesterase n=1 Tax=Pseudomonas sp. GOM7 TaxID=2998079 RepID=UPI00227C940E|nr:phosphodiesterase [Pseudomonas sp. GOM7]WAJ39402.1 phosphodiesterase [Pseudomonas sp. GOM7]